MTVANDYSSQTSINSHNPRQTWDTSLHFNSFNTSKMCYHTYADCLHRNYGVTSSFPIPVSVVSMPRPCPAPLPHPHPPLPRPRPAPLSHPPWLLPPSDKVLKVNEEFSERHTSSYRCYPLKLEVLLLETPTEVDDPVTMISVITSQLACIFDLLIRFCRSLMRTAILYIKHRHTASQWWWWSC